MQAAKNRVATAERGGENTSQNVAEKNRVDTLLMSLGVQFPSEQQAYNSAYGSITYSGKNVNIPGKRIPAKDIKSMERENKSIDELLTQRRQVPKWQSGNASINKIPQS